MNPRDKFIYLLINVANTSMTKLIEFKMIQVGFNIMKSNYIQLFTKLDMFF